MAAATASRTETMITTTEAAVNTIKDDLFAYVKELETKSPNIMTQLEDLQALQGVHPPEHDAHDRSNVEEDLQYALRHYLDGASSLCSDWTDRSTPSFQVSSFQPTDSFLTTVYHTAKTHRSTDAGTVAMPLNIIWVSITAGLGRTALVRIQSSATISDLKTSIRRTIGFPGTELDLMHQGRLVSEQSSTLEEAGIFGFSRLSCNFRLIRPLTPPPRDVPTTFVNDWVKYPRPVRPPFPRPVNFPLRRFFRVLTNEENSEINQLPVRAGELVQLLREYDDGWALCFLVYCNKQLEIQRHRVSACQVACTCSDFTSLSASYFDYRRSQNDRGSQLLGEKKYWNG